MPNRLTALPFCSVSSSISLIVLQTITIPNIVLNIKSPSHNPSPKKKKNLILYKNKITTKLERDGFYGFPSFMGFLLLWVGFMGFRVSLFWACLFSNLIETTKTIEKPIKWKHKEIKRERKRVILWFVSVCVGYNNAIKQCYLKTKNCS